MNQIAETDAGIFHDELDAPFQLGKQQVSFFKENGYVKLEHVFSPALLAHYRGAINARVAELSAEALPMDQRSTYGKAFLQVMNLWTESPEARAFVFGKRLARIAAELMEVSGVRLYHDQALYKEPGGGITPWHADQYYWPVDSDKTITAWVPLQETPRAMGPLAFCEKSHLLEFGRDLEISDESEKKLERELNRFPINDSAYALGEVSFHAGWTFHRAGANTTGNPREVMTVIYMDENIRLTPPRNKGHVLDLERWAPGLGAGDLLSSSLNPVVYASRSHAGSGGAEPRP